MTKIKMYDLDIEKTTLLQQVRKVWEEVREVEQAIVKSDIYNFFEECNDVMQAVYTMQRLCCKLKGVDLDIIKIKNDDHIKKMELKYNKTKK